MTTATLSAVTRYVRRIAAHDPRALTDRHLLDCFTRERDEAAFAELVRRHGPMVLGVCRRVLRHEQDAEDAFQTAFLVLARKAGAVRHHDSFAGWLYQVTRRLALRARAAADRRRLTPLSDAAEAVPAPPAPQDGPAASLDEELQRLPEPYRSALVLCCVEGRTQAEAARLLATTAAAINSRLKRGREVLRRRLARRGLLLSGAAVAEALGASAARAALPAALIGLTARAALNSAGTGAVGLAAALARGVFHMLTTSKVKILAALAVAVALVTAGALSVPPAALGDDPVAAAPRPGGQAKEPGKPAQPPGGKAKPRRSVILLWMGGGPSQIDTFDPKPKDANGALFPAIDTAVKGVQFSQGLPRLAKLADRLTVIRTVTHRDGDHNRATGLMRTGHLDDQQTDYPDLPSLIGKELRAGRGDLPRYVSIGAPQRKFAPSGYGPGFLGAEHGPLVVAEQGQFGQEVEARLALPPAAAFEALAKGRGEQARKAVAKAFDLAEEKKEVRDAYGRELFGQGCLLARRLVEAGVPVVEVTLGGWDTHANAQPMMQTLHARLDGAWSRLLKDLEERKLLDSTLIVWMGEFGRTPKINNAQGRDHWPTGFSVVLAGGGTKRGAVVGKTSADGTKIEERPVSVPELMATICQAAGVDPTRENRSNTGRMVPLVEKGAKAVKEALR